MMIDSSLISSRRVTLAADRGHDARELVSALRSRNVTPHLAHTNRRARRGRDADREARRVRGQPAHPAAHRVDLRVDEVDGGPARSRVRGLQRTQLAAHLVAAAYNLIRIAKLTTAAA